MPRPGASRSSGGAGANREPPDIAAIWRAADRAQPTSPQPSQIHNNVSRQRSNVSSATAMSGDAAVAPVISRQHPQISEHTFQIMPHRYLAILKNDAIPQHLPELSSSMSPIYNALRRFTAAQGEYATASRKDDARPEDLPQRGEISQLRFFTPPRRFGASLQIYMPCYHFSSSCRAFSERCGEVPKIAARSSAPWVPRIRVAAFSSATRPRSTDNAATSPSPGASWPGLRHRPWSYARVFRDYSEVTRTCGKVAGAAATPSDEEPSPIGLEGR